MNTLIVNIGQLVTPVPTSTTLAASSLEIHERTKLLIRNHRIAAIGRTDESEPIDQVIDARGGVVLPGLIDAHTHFPSTVVESNGSEPQTDSQSDAAAKAAQAIVSRLRRAMVSGITTMEMKCRNLTELRNLSTATRSSDGHQPAVIATLFEAAPASGVSHADRMASLIGDAIPTVRRLRLARFCDVECGADAYSLDEARTMLRAARAACLHLSVHQDGTSVSDLGSVAEELGITSIGHVSKLGIKDAGAMRRAGVIPILLPAEGLIGTEPYADADMLIEGGLAVGLGTNAGFAAVGTGSIWLVIALAVTALGMSLEQAICAVTLHNAHALEAAAEIGTVEPGKQADLAILDLADYRDLLGGLGDNPVRLLIRGGEVVHEQ